MNILDRRMMLIPDADGFLTARVDLGSEGYLTSKEPPKAYPVVCQFILWADNNGGLHATRCDMYMNHAVALLAACAPPEPGHKLPTTGQLGSLEKTASIALIWLRAALEHYYAELNNENSDAAWEQALGRILEAANVRPGAAPAPVSAPAARVAREELIDL